ncbi:MAG: tetratricopeptide repeat protein [Phycisphaerae bacterium]
MVAQDSRSVSAAVPTIGQSRDVASMRPASIERIEDKPSNEVRSASSQADIIEVRHKEFAIAYEVNEAALPLDSVELWYTRDRGFTWTMYGTDPDLRSPVAFLAPREGLYGFYFRMVNKTGASGKSPEPGIRPHLSAFIDFSPPVVFLNPLVLTENMGRRMIQLRWAAMDTQLADRPIQIEYRLVDGQTTDRGRQDGANRSAFASYGDSSAGSWQQATDTPLADTSRYDWGVPSELTGLIEFRIKVRDRGGNVTISDAQGIRLERQPAALVRGTTGSSHGNGRTVSPTSREEALLLLRQGRQLRGVGDWNLAMNRLRRAAEMDPGLTDAFVEMADLLYSMEDFDKAMHAYDIVLAQDPANRLALQGSARIFKRRAKYSQAASRLREALNLYPNDAEFLVNLGDIAIFLGDEVAARRSYKRALESEGASPEFLEMARKRLGLMAATSRQYE